MTNALIACRSVTYTQRGARVLSRAGIRANTKRLSTHLPETGCGYAIRIDLEDLPRAVSILREAGFPAQATYQEDGEGGWQRL